MSRSNLRQSVNIYLLFGLISGVVILQGLSVAVATLIGALSVALGVLANWKLSLLRDDQLKRLRDFLEKTSFTWALLALMLVIWTINAVLLDFPNRVQDALVGRKRIVVQIVPGEGLIQLLNGLKRRGDIALPLEVHVRNGKTYSKDVVSAGIVYTGAPEERLREVATTVAVTNPPTESRRELVTYLRGLGVPSTEVDNIVNIWSVAEFLPTENLRAGDVVDVWLGCEGGKAWMVKTGPKVLEKKDVYPIYLEVGGKNPCAKTD